MNGKTFLFMSIFILLILSAIVTAQSQTLITGKVYDQSNSPVNGVNVIVTCNGNTGSGTSMNDGTYGVYIDANLCTSGDSATATGTINNQNDSESSSVQQCTDQLQCTSQGTQGDVSNIALINLFLKPIQTNDNTNTNTGGNNYQGGGGGNSYVAPKNKTNSTTTTNTTAVNVNSLGNSANNSSLNNTSNNSNSGPSSAGITGATIGSGAKAGIIGLIILIVVVLIFYVIVKVNKNPVPSN